MTARLDAKTTPPVVPQPVVAMLTLGCKLNQAESQVLARQLEDAGCAVIDRPAPADGFVINTCTVTHVADRKARHLVRMVKRLSPSAPVVVTGCYAEWAAEHIAANTGADLVLGNGIKDGAATRLLGLLSECGRETRTPEITGARRRSGRTRAFIKIQEGCNDVCAFCIVPRVRGRERAVPIPEVVRAAQAREAAGALEIVLTGTQPGAYGRDRDDGATPAALIESLLAETTLPRIRYSSIQPQDLTNEFLQHWADSRMCRHFHLALQSGSDAVLGTMRRHYNARQFLAAIQQIRAAVPGASITSDVIVGFPGETAHDFQDTVRVAEEAEFSDIHVFPYSQRPGTGAALRADDVPPAIKRERVSMLRGVARRGALAFRASLCGTTQAVLFERGRSGTEGVMNWSGLTDSYLPVLTRTARSIDLENRLVATRLSGELDGTGVPGALRGRVLEWPGPS